MSRDRIEQRIRRGQPLDHIPVIDFHCHIGASSDYYYVPRSRPEQVVGCMDRFGIDHIVTFAFNATSDPRPGNRLQYEAARAFPRRITPLTMLHAKFPQDWLELLHEGSRLGSRGIKLISQYQGADETRINWSPAFDFAKDHGWVVLHHSWGPAERLAEWAKAYPRIVFIAGHATVEYKDVIEKYDNVYQNTSACFVTGHYASVEKMAAVLPPERILYGSDALDLDFGIGIGPVARARIPEHAKEMILGANALGLFRRLGWPLTIGKG